MLVSRRALLTLPQSRSIQTGDEERPRPRAGYWIHLNRPAMACRFEITLPAELSHRLDTAKAALDTIDALEAQLTIFRETSELAAINRDAAENAVTVERNLHDLLVLCQQLSAATDGAFDITSTPLSRAWGFLRREGRLPEADELAAARANVGMDKVILASNNDAAGASVKTIRFTQPGVSLNLGGVGKGFALDRIANDMIAAGTETALLTAGSSSFRAIGDGPDGTGFRVGLRDPFDHTRRYGSVTLRDNALGVSGAGEQFFEAPGNDGPRRLGHIIDPRSGWPVEGRALVAVTAPSATLADALATAFFVGGPAIAARYTADHPEVSVVILDMPISGQRPQARFFGPASKQWRVSRAA
jgi:thiamine biosynthesis lipoprotein